MTDRKTYFIDAILPVPIPRHFTYRVPFQFNDFISEGMRVVVEFGKRGVLTAIVAKIHETPPKDYQAKYVLEILDEKALVPAVQIKFWQWIADYYMCTIGEVMNAGIPSGLKLNSQSKIQLNPEFDFQNEQYEFSPKEEILINAIEAAGAIPYDQAAEILNVKNAYLTIKYLTTKKVIIIFDEINEKYKPKKIVKIRLNPTILENESGLQDLFEKLSKKIKQQDVLLKYLSFVPVQNDKSENESGIEKRKLVNEGQEISSSSLQTLIKNNVFESFEVIVSRFDEDEYQLVPSPEDNFELSTHQQKAYDDIIESFKSKDTILFHGVTGSGKTEVYIRLIENVLNNGEQVLLLLPEIVITAQIVNRLRKIFGSNLGVFHSKFSDNERVEVWKGVAEGKFNVVIGVRSAIFLPFDNLGLVIVDEEHEGSYKQYDPAPRYHARDMALMLGKFQHAKTLLGSATPSVESYYLAKKGQYGLVTLDKRFGNAELPKVIFANTRTEKIKRKMKNEFSSVLMEQIQEHLKRDEQIILFQNRRGYAPFLTCEDCAWIPKCDNCSVSLTYHLYRNELRCHYCGHREATPRSCMACGSTKIQTVGVGTEKIEDELKLLLPETRIQRMDLDTTRKKYSYQTIISDFENKNIDVLVGTQMVSKGLDFDNVGLVGVFDVDRIIHFPDFRAHERTFQLVTQVSGRAGRRDKEGLVVIQTANEKQPILKWIAQNDYISFFRYEIRERKEFNYPPFTRLIKVTVKAIDQKTRDEAGVQLCNKLKNKLGKNRVLGPQYPIIDKVRNNYLNEVIIKLERNKINLRVAKDKISESIHEILKEKAFNKIRISVDVDSV